MSETSSNRLKNQPQLQAEASASLEGGLGLPELEYIKNIDAFWRNVQEPSTRIKDPALLARLAFYSLNHFDDPFVRAAAAVVLLYRATEPTWTNIVSPKDLLSVAHSARKLLCPKNDFSSCRWFISTSLAIGAFHLCRDEKEAAFLALDPVHALLPFAIKHGQPFTNIVKSNLLRLSIAAANPALKSEVCSLQNEASEVLAYSQSLASNYKFVNEFAYEEVAYVYTMLREIYNWSRLVKEGLKDLRDLESAGFRWKRVGAPFGTLLKA